MQHPYFIGSDIYRGSSYGKGHPLAIPRVYPVIDLCRALGWLPDSAYVESRPATPEQLARFHRPEYIAALMRAEAEQQALPDFNIGVNGNPVYGEVFRRPATSAGGSITAARLVADGGCVFHPAGGTHHGRPDHAFGFCYLNDPVLGLYALLDQGLERILYLDLDAHHGDGVQEAFHDEDRVFTISVHEANRWPRTGLLHDRAGGMARNLPVPPGFNDSEMCFLVTQALLPLAEDFQPQAIVIQCGADALADDPLSKLELSNRALWRSVAAFRDLAPRLIVLGGGGYNPWSAARCWTGLWALLNDHPLPERLPPQAEEVMRALWWDHRRGRNAPEHWFTTLADTPHPGPVREEIRAVVRAVMA
ncbi:acetoin utilization protein AcuC [Telmatospirillum sp. J64-1]|uniref:acetoin utilization protein AcuC n=1 Tax=Telmatospirillum sp. J64-1 TaxID=2502183 RepID=UPI00115E1E45|nr:acetoin utilization protein AcuC [Telmatospirillum sp. J64-1]